MKGKFLRILGGLALLLAVAVPAQAETVTKLFNTGDTVVTETTHNFTDTTPVSVPMFYQASGGTSNKLPLVALSLDCRDGGGTGFNGASVHVKDSLTGAIAEAEITTYNGTAVTISADGSQKAIDGNHAFSSQAVWIDADAVGDVDCTWITVYGR